jgi:hypothetical protein
MNDEYKHKKNDRPRLIKKIQMCIKHSTMSHLCHNQITIQKVFLWNPIVLFLVHFSLKIFYYKGISYDLMHTMVQPKFKTKCMWFARFLIQGE